MTNSDVVPAWRQFAIHLDSLDPDVVEEIFTRFGATSVTLTDAGDDPVIEPGPGETPLWADTKITGLFSAETDLQPIKTALLTEFDLTVLPENRTEDLVDRDWEREWLKDFGPMQFGRRLWICPTGAAVTQPDAVVVQLDPGLAFGTGTHPTTAMCLDWLDGLSLAGKSLLDYGCGSGVLAIAGLRLGCGAATAFDIDPQALVATRRNSTRNGVMDSIRLCAHAREIEGTFDVVVANILAGPLIEFAESITSALTSHGMLALSGVLCEQADDVMEAFAPWIDFDEPAIRHADGHSWSRLTGKLRNGQVNDVYPMS